MKFMVKRTSLECVIKEDKPCEDAVKEDGRWMVEINSLEELLAFMEKEGRIIINEEFTYRDSELHSLGHLIEIYDNYRE